MTGSVGTVLLIQQAIIKAHGVSGGVGTKLKKIMVKAFLQTFSSKQLVGVCLASGILLNWPLSEAEYGLFSARSQSELARLCDFLLQMPE